MHHLTIVILAIMAVVAITAFASPSSPNLRDALLKYTLALPSSTTAVTAATSLDTGAADNNAFQTGAYELLLTAPALTTAQLPDTKTMTYDIIQSANANLSSPVALYPGVLIQTGAGGVGAAGNTFRARIPSNALRYIGFKITPSASGTGDASGASATLEAVF